MNEEIDESEFYQQDFTTASEWEIFVARMEEIINQWKTEDMKNEPSPVAEVQNIWEIRSEKLCFVDFDFILHYYKKKIDISDISESSDENEIQDKNPIDGSYDFELFDESNVAEHSSISSWYGIQEFIVLSPANNVGIISESKIKILLSSLNLVSSNLKCGKPMFVQIREKWQKCYLGVYEGEGTRTNFEMVHLRKGPQHCHYLSGLLDLFKTKIMSPITVENIIVSMQHTYSLVDFGNFVWKQNLLDNDNFDTESMFILPFGVTVDPVSTILLKTTWNHVMDHMVIDSESYSDFDPIGAPKWSCLAKMTNEPVCLLGDSLTEFLQNLGNNSSVYDILGDFAALPSNDSNPLDLLTEPGVPTISSLITRAARHSLSKSRRGIPPVSENILVPLLYFLFPDADEKSSFPYSDREDKEPVEKTNKNVMFKKLDEEFKGFKTCSTDSLVWRLSIILAHSLQSLGGLKALAHIWYEFVQEMRYRWDKSLPIPGLSPGFPDLRTCLLNQKLQMLNCCIERKLSRENIQHSSFDSAEDSSTDEEFFDCSDKSEEESKKKHSLWNQPVGRLSKFGNLKLLKTGDCLYIPITQEPVLKTEDQLEEDTDVLLKLGSNAEATELRARIMSACLLSDMESFKAANPGSVVEDFIRWYSPRDWIEENEEDEWGQKKGHLSPRMLIEDNNIWVQMWESAKPVPANRQRRLFDDTREAEKVLQFLDFRNISQICEMIIPVLAHTSIYRLVEECQMLDAEVAEGFVRISSLLKHGEWLSRDPKFQMRRFETFAQEVTALELLISQMNSLQYKLNPSGAEDESTNKLISGLVTGKEIEIAGKSESVAGGKLVSMFTEAQKLFNVTMSEDDNGRNLVTTVFPLPSEKEIVLRVNAVRPSLYSVRSPQFLRAVLTKHDFRLAGAFTEDIIFF